MIYYYNEKQNQLQQNSNLDRLAEEVLDEEASREEEYSSDTWKQLLQHYTYVSAFGENNTYDFVQGSLDLLAYVMEGKELLRNTFLMHGYYNYHHVLIARKIEEDDCYYVAVPGNDYPREKVVSDLFGFEQFISKDTARNRKGVYGYYLIRVRIKEEVLNE